MEFINKVMAGIISEVLMEEAGSLEGFTQQAMEADLRQGELYLSKAVSAQVVEALLNMGHVITVSDDMTVAYVHELNKTEGVMFTRAEDEDDCNVWGYYKH